MERFVILLALAGLSYLLLYTEGLVKTSRARFAMLGVLLAAFGVRFILFGIAPNDTAAAVEDAIVWYRDAGGFWGIRSSALPYSIPVQYFLALFSLAPGGGLTLFKYICVFAEVTMAWAAQRCVQCVTVRAQPRLFAFLIVLLLPSGIFQGVCSAAGDSLWWVFIALAASCAMRGEWRWCAGMLALAVAFHPAALWIVPVFWVFTAVRRNTWFSLLHLVGWYIAVLVPALLLGRPGSECLPFYPALGTLTARPLFGGAPGIYSLSQHSFIAPTGIALYIVFALLLVWRMSRKSLASDRRRQLTALSLASLCAVAFLPWMCADSLYGAEVLLVALCCLEPKVIPAAVCASFASALALFLQNDVVHQMAHGGHHGADGVAQVLHLIGSAHIEVPRLLTGLQLLDGPVQLFHRGGDPLRQAQVHEYQQKHGEEHDEEDFKYCPRCGRELEER